MTVLVGILCKDGIVLASDSAATFGTGTQSTIGQQEVQKINQVNIHVLYCATGAVGMSQLISNRIRELWEAKEFVGKISPDGAMDKIGKAIAALVAPYMQTAQIQQNLTGGSGTSLCKSLLAISVDRKPHLFQFDFNGAPERCTADLPFVSMGSGQTIADPFLAFLHRLMWFDKDPTLAEGRLAAVWTIDHVRRTNPGGVGGATQLATLVAKIPGELPLVEMSNKDVVEEHMQRIGDAENTLRKELLGTGVTSSLSLPVPPG